MLNLSNKLNKDEMVHIILGSCINRLDLVYKVYCLPIT